MNRRLDLATAGILAAATAALFLLVWLDGTRPTIRRVDGAFLRTMVDVRSAPLTALAHVLNVLGSIWVTLPARLLVAAFLGIKRRWWHFIAFVSAMIVSEAAVGTLKALYDRPRPSGSLVETSSASFPSGHAVAAAVTAVAIVIALFPPAGLHRWLWGTAAAVFAFLMALSRAYLAAHWLSDAVAGTLLGTSIALGTAVIVQGVRGKGEGRGAGPPGERPSRS